MKLSDMKWTSEVMQAIWDKKINRLLDMGFYSITYTGYSANCSIKLKEAAVDPDEFANYKRTGMGAEYRFYEYFTSKSTITVAVPETYKGEDRAKEIVEMIFKEREV